MARKTELIPAVTYIRMSSPQQEGSPEQQRAELPKLAAKFGCRIIREYYEPGISGDATEKREAFQRMARDAQEKGDFAAILCWDQDRFGRFDPIEAGRWIYPLREAGVRLITAGQGEIDWGTFAGRIIYMVQQEGKHQFLIDLSKNVLRGKIDAAKQGRGATVPPYGYDRAFYDQAGKLAKRVPYGEKFTKPKGWAMRFVISEDAEAVAIVRWIFDTFANTDCGLGWIAGDLNNRGIPSPQGKTWSVQTVQAILSNVVYTGASKFGEKRHGKYHHMGKDGEITKGPGRYADGEPIIVDGAHDALIDQALFTRVQEKMSDRSREGNRPRYSRYLLSGLLRCGHCGGPMNGKGTNGEDSYRYYICVNGATRPGTCHRYQIPQEDIERYVLGVIEKELLSDKSVEKIIAALRRNAKKKPAFRDMAKNLKAQIEALDKKISKGTENLLLADDVDDMADMSRLLGGWRKERENLQKQLERSALAPDQRPAAERMKQAMAKLEQMREYMKSGDPMKVRAVIQSYVKEVRLWWESYGKRNKRLVRGTMQLSKQLALLSGGSKTASASSSAPVTAIGRQVGAAGRRRPS